MSICVTESLQSRRMLDEQHDREDAQARAEADLAYDFTRSIELGDPDAMPGWTGTCADYDAAKRLGLKAVDGIDRFPRRRVTVEEAMRDALDYPSGPGIGDVVKVLSLAMKGNDPIVALAARQLVERAAAKFAEHNAPEVDA